MEQLRYIHSADLHLDSPFRGINSARLPASLINSLREAPYTALHRLVELCEAEKPDFLVIAGDIYNQEEAGIRPQLELYGACKNLARLNIPVYMAHGNHDPIASRLSSIQWPENTFIFGPEAESQVFYKNGAPAAVIHGISHSREKEDRNLAQLFMRGSHPDCFHLGVLHCAVDGAHQGDRYAPCSLEDLRSAKMDAWALGHEHTRRVLDERPFIAYCGNSQGLHINECGPKGCVVVTASLADNGWQCESQFRQLAPIQWEKPVISLDGVETLDGLDKILSDRLERLAAQADPAVRAIIARVRLEGATGLDGVLRDDGAEDDLRQRANYLTGGHPAIWLKDVEVATCSPVPDDCEQRDDLLGESCRIVRRLLEDPDRMREFCQNALDPLYNHGYGRQHLSRADDEQLRELLGQALRVCQNALESK